MSSEIVLASTQLAQRLGVTKEHMIETVKAQCFKNPGNVSDTQLAAFFSIANEMGVNPLLPGMLYAYPTQGGGIVPMMGPDGVFKKLSEHPSVDSWEVQVYPEDVTQPPTHAIAKIYRKGSTHPLTFTAVVSEWMIKQNPNWIVRPRHMIHIRALKQCARQVIHGIPFDEDERQISEMVNVTPVQDSPSPAASVSRPTAPARRGSAAAAKAAQPDAIDIEAKKPAPAVTEAAPVPMPEAPPTEPVLRAPDIVPGVGHDEFHGKPWPVTLTDVKIVSKKVAKTTAGAAVAQIVIEHNQFAGTVFCLEGVGLTPAGAAEVTADWLHDGSVIEATLYSKLRPKTVDGKSVPDYSRPPNLFMKDVRAAAPSDAAVDA